MRLKVNTAAVAVKTVGRPSVGEARLQPRYFFRGEWWRSHRGRYPQEIERAFNKTHLLSFSHFAVIQFLSMWFSG